MKPFIIKEKCAAQPEICPPMKSCPNNDFSYIEDDEPIGGRIEIDYEKCDGCGKGFIKKHINNNQDADDILQNVFYKIQTNIGSLKDAEKLHSWVYAIARNAIVDF